MSMRSSFVAVAVVVGTVFVVGCSQMGQSTSPTAPSSVSSATSSSAVISPAGAAVTHEVSIEKDVYFQIVPGGDLPCIQEPIDITGTFIETFIEVIDPNGGVRRRHTEHLANARGVGTESGQTYHISFGEVRGGTRQGPNGEFTDIAHFTVTTPGGGVLQGTFIEHFVFNAPNGLVVDVEIENIHC